ncbi:MAG: CHAT domain-containing protein, partial [Bacteroidota bacterium]
MKSKEKSAMYTLSKDILKFMMLAAIILIGYQESFAQYPVTITTIANPPYPLKPSDYSDNPTKVIATIMNNGTTTLHTRFVGRIEGLDNGIKLSTNPNSKPPVATLLQPGVPLTLNLISLKNILNFDEIVYTNINKETVIRSGLPEGVYQICLTAYDYWTDNTPLSEVDGGCSVPIMLNLVDPPIIMQPFCDDKITATTPQNIVFSWASSPGAPVTTQYDFKMVEVVPASRNINDALNSSTSPVFFEQRTLTNILIYGPAQPKLEPGKRYAFVVKAFDPNPMSAIAFRNEGISEACSFVFGDVDTSKANNPFFIQPLNITGIPNIAEILPAPTAHSISTASWKDSTLTQLNNIHQRAIKEGNILSAADAEFYIGNKYVKQGDMVKGKEYYQQSLFNLSKIGKANNRYVVYYNLGVCQQSTGSSLESRASFVSALSNFENMPPRDQMRMSAEAGGSDLTGEMYTSVSGSYAKSNMADSALVYLEKSNNTATTLARGAQPVAYQSDVNRGMLSQEQKLYNQIDSLFTIITDAESNTSSESSKISALINTVTVLENQYLSFVDSIIEAKPELAINFSRNVNPKDLFADKDRIPEKTALVEYMLSDSMLYIFFVTKDVVVSRYTPINAAAFEESVEKYAQLLAKKYKLDYIWKMSDELYKKLISPIEEYLGGIENIAIVPSGKLYRIPFQSLGKLSSDKKSFSYLIESKGIFYVNSLKQFYVSDKQNVQKKVEIVAFGNPDKTLPFAEFEVNELKKIAKKSEIYLGTDATEARAKSIPEGFDVLHFATHGVLDFNKF